jgi:hypothetical protein
MRADAELALAVAADEPVASTCAPDSRRRALPCVRRGSRRSVRQGGTCRGANGQHGGGGDRTDAASALAAERGDTAAGDELASSTAQIVQKHGIEEYAGNALRMAVSARAHLRAGRWQHARADLDAAQRLLQRLEALPWLAAQTRLELARAHLATRDSAERGPRRGRARASGSTLTRECAQLNADVPNVGHAPDGRSSGLTDAELRLPRRSRRTSFREMESACSSRGTIKTRRFRLSQVASRIGDAVERSRARSRRRPARRRRARTRRCSRQPARYLPRQAPADAALWGAGETCRSAIPPT